MPTSLKTHRPTRIRRLFASLSMALAVAAESHAACPTPAFTGPATMALPVAGTPRAIAPTDFNADGLVDLLVAIDAGSASAVVQLRAVGDGTFARNTGPGAPTMGFPVSTSPSAVAVGFLNRDAWPDVIVGTASGVAIWIGNGSTGTYGPGGSIFRGQAVLDVAIADWDRDGRPDIVAAFADGLTRIFRNLNDSGSFDDAYRLDEGSAGGRVGRIVVGDVRGGGAVNLVGASFQDGILQFSRRLRPSSATLVGSYADPWQPALGDIDLDGNLDLVVTHPNDRVIRVWRGRYRGPAFADLPATDLLTELPAIDLAASAGTPGAFPFDIEIADVTADNRHDLIVTDPANDAVWVLMGDGAGGFAPPHRLDAGPTPLAVVVGRVDQDGAPDVVVVDETDALLRVHRNACPTMLTNLTVGGMEVTQVVQDLTNSTELVAGRRTFVRAHPLASAGSHLVTATLQARNGAGVPLPGTLRPLAPGLVGQASGVLLRRNLEDGLLFELPPEWTVAGDLELTLNLNPDRRVAESTYSDNQRTETVQLQSMPPIKIELVRFGYRMGDGTEVLPAEEDLAKTVSILRRMLPVDRLVITESTFHSATVFSWADTPNVKFLDLRDGEDVLNDFKNATQGTRRSGVIYLVTTGRRNLTGGIAESIGGWVGVVPPQDSKVVVHELGHLMGRRHVECTTDPTDEDGPDPAYPYPTGTMGGPNRASPSFVGLDLGDASLAPARPTMAIWPDTGIRNEIVGDVMSYCQESWTSDYSYEAIAARFRQLFPLADPFGDFLAVRGAVDRSDRVRHFAAMRIDQASFIPPREKGAFAIRLLDENDESLAEYPFTPKSGQEIDEFFSFDEIVTFVPGTRRVVLVGHEKEIASLPVSPNAPEVRATLEPEVRELGEAPITVRITVRDADDDELATDVLWSPDEGASWRVVTAANRDAKVVVDPRELVTTHGAPTGILRVRVRDGVHTSHFDLTSLSYLGSAPDVRITSPFADSSHAQGQTLMLAAVAADADDGTPPGDAIAWYSDLDGYLGKGAHLAPALSEGTHVLTAVVTDADGSIGNAQTRVRIARVLPRHSPPTAIAVVPRTSRAGDRISLDASASVGYSDEPLRLFWQVVTSPQGGMFTPAVDQIDPRRASFEATVPGRYGLRLVAADSQGTSTTEVSVHVEEVPEPHGALAFGVLSTFGLASMRRRRRGGSANQEQRESHPATPSSSITATWPGLNDSSPARGMAHDVRLASAKAQDERTRLLSSRMRGPGSRPGNETRMPSVRTARSRTRPPSSSWDLEIGSPEDLIRPETNASTGSESQTRSVKVKAQPRRVVPDRRIIPGVALAALEPAQDAARSCRSAWKCGVRFRAEPKRRMKMTAPHLR